MTKRTRKWEPPQLPKHRHCVENCNNEFWPHWSQNAESTGCV